MPKYKHTLTDSECNYFHKNYVYMWDKLGFTYYAATMKSGADSPVSSELRNLLPTYAICSRCYNDESYKPGRATVGKIVKFYNAQILPPIDIFQFLNDDLRLSDNLRYTDSDICDPHFVGLYQGFYPSMTENSILGSYLKVFVEDARLKVVAIVGMRNDLAMKDKELLNLISHKRPQYHDYETYQRANPIDSDVHRYTFYEGTVDLTQDSFFVYLRCNNRNQRKLAMTLNLSAYHPANPERDYIGGLAFMLASSDGPFDSRFYKMAIVRVNDAWSISINDPELQRFLKPKSTNNSIVLNTKDDTDWYIYIMNHRKPNSGELI